MWQTVIPSPQSCPLAINTSRAFHTALSPDKPIYRRGSGAVYPKLYAAILPIVMPLLLAMHLFHFDPASADWVDDLGLRLRLGFCLFMSLLVVVFYPREGKLSGWPLSTFYR